MINVRIKNLIEVSCRKQGWGFRWHQLKKWINVQKNGLKKPEQS